MLAVLPTHNGDRHLAVQLCDHIARLGGTKNHEAMIVCPANTNLDGIESALRDSFGSVFVHRYTATMQGWPFGPNEACAEAMLKCWVDPQLRYHYLMLEPDCVPTTKFWMDMLDMDFRRCGQPVMGVRVPTIEIDTKRQVGTHVVGVAVYAKNFAQLCPLVRGLVNATKAYQLQKVTPPPWDAYFGPYTHRLAAETTLIQHLLRVRMVAPDGSVTWDCPNLENALSQVQKSAVLVHGSKDPQFLRALTNSTEVRPPAAITHAIEKREEIHQQQHQGDAQGQTIRESGEPPGESASRQNGNRSSDAPVTETLTAQQKRDNKKLEGVREAWGIEFPIRTPEFSRACFFNDKFNWPKIKQYAAKLGIQSFKRTKGKLICLIVLKEIENGTEEWTKKLPKPVPPPPPLVPLEGAPPVPVTAISTSVKTTVPFNTVDEQGRLIQDAPPAQAAVISDERAKRMRQMLAERNLLRTG